MRLFTSYSFAYSCSIEFPPKSVVEKCRLLLHLFLTLSIFGDLSLFFISFEILEVKNGLKASCCPRPAAPFWAQPPPFDKRCGLAFTQPWPLGGSFLKIGINGQTHLLSFDRTL